MRSYHGELLYISIDVCMYMCTCISSPRFSGATDLEGAGHMPVKQDYS